MIFFDKSETVSGRWLKKVPTSRDEIFYLFISRLDLPDHRLVN